MKKVVAFELFKKLDNSTIEEIIRSASIVVGTVHGVAQFKLNVDSKTTGDRIDVSCNGAAGELYVTLLTALLIEEIGIRGFMVTQTPISGG